MKSHHHQQQTWYIPPQQMPASARRPVKSTASSWWSVVSSTLPFGGGLGRRLIQVALIYLLLVCWALWGGEIPSPPNILDASRFVSSEASLVDPIALVSVSLPPSVTLSSDPKNESLITELSEADSKKDDSKSKVAKKNEGVSDATLPPDLVPRDHLPTSTPSVAPAIEDAKTEVPDVPKQTIPAPEVTVPAEQKPDAAAKVDTPVPGTVHNASEEADTGEEIPSFNEWAQKKLADAEKRKVQNASEPPKATPKVSNNLKLRSKNYASPDCGAKILAANAEAQSVSSVLSPSRDEYALNPCTSSKIWFVVELCEAIQAKQIELANFELFSSSPKDFSVWVSDRFPTREWHLVGQLQAQDERTVQSFSVDSNIFGKFVRIEQHSHWGSEHFCPVSLLRVYGTSEFEVFDTDDEGHGPRSPEDDVEDDDLTTVPGGDAPKNLFGSARDAVISIVKKAAQVLGKSGDSKNKTEITLSPELTSICGMSPLLDQDCPECSPAVQQLLICRSDILKTMLASRFVLRSLQHEQLCLGHVVHNDSYLAALLPTEYISALCHLLLALHKPQTTTAAPNYDNLTLGQPQDPFLLLQPSETTTCSQKEATITSKSEEQPLLSQSSVPLATSSARDTASDVASQIKPTRTLKNDAMSEDSSATVPVVATLLPDIPSQPPPAAGSTLPAENSTVMAVETAIPVEEEAVDADVTKVAEDWPTGEQIDSLIADLKDEGSELEQASTTHTTPTSAEVELEHPVQVPPPTSPSPSSTVTAPSAPQQLGQQKESVLVRLANRIKVLERNMSLSAQYLEELSKRYKKQVEEMQKAFERTLTAVGEAARQSSQREQAHAEQITSLEQRVASLAATTAALLAERESWHHKITVVSQHFILIAVFLYILISLIRQCTPSTGYREPTPEPLVVPSIRRRSADELTLHRKRRSSEETGICEKRSLIHIESNKENTWIDPSKKKRRKLRRDLRGISVEDLCSGLSPATLAAVRHQPLYKPLLPKQGVPSRLSTNPKCRRFSTESAPMLKIQWNLSSNVPEVKVNGKKETREEEASKPPTPPPPHPLQIIRSDSLPSTPSQQQKKQSGLRKMVRKLF